MYQQRLLKTLRQQRSYMFTSVSTIHVLYIHIFVCQLVISTSKILGRRFASNLYLGSLQDPLLWGELGGGRGTIKQIWGREMHISRNSKITENIISF